MNSTNDTNSTTDFTILLAIPNPQLKAVGSLIFVVTSSFLILLAMSGNLFIVVNLVRKSPITVNNHLIINLCCADIFKCLLFCPMFYLSTLSGSWLLGDASCKILPEFYRGCQFYSVSILTTQTMFRYAAIKDPLNQKHCFWQRKRVIYTCLLMTFLSNTLPRVLPNRLTFRAEENEDEIRCVLFHRKNILGRLMNIVSSFITPQIIFVVYYVAIKKELEKNSNATDIAACSERLVRNKKAIKTILASVLAFDILLLPAILSYSLAMAYQEVSFLRETGELFQLAYSCVNPALLIWRSQELKNNLKGLVSKTPRQPRNNVTERSSCCVVSGLTLSMGFSGNM